MGSYASVSLTYQVYYFLLGDMPFPGVDHHFPYTIFPSLTEWKPNSILRFGTFIKLDNSMNLKAFGITGPKWNLLLCVWFFFIEHYFVIDQTFLWRVYHYIFLYEFKKFLLNSEKIYFLKFSLNVKWWHIFISFSSLVSFLVKEFINISV